MNKSLQRYFERKGIEMMPDDGGKNGWMKGVQNATFFRWFQESVMGFDSEAYRRAFWREALTKGHTIGPKPYGLEAFVFSRRQTRDQALARLLLLCMAMGGAFMAWWITRQVMYHVRQLQRPTYYEAERTRRLGLATERRRFRRRRTLNACPTVEMLRDGFLRAKESSERMILFGSLLEDLECYVDNSLIIDRERGGIVGRHGGIRGYLREHAPDLSAHYKTIMRYKALARKFRQAASVRDPVAASAILPSTIHTARQKARTSEKAGMAQGAAIDAARKIAEEVLRACDGTIISLEAQLAMRLSAQAIPAGNRSAPLHRQSLRHPS